MVVTLTNHQQQHIHFFLVSLVKHSISFLFMLLLSLSDIGVVVPIQKRIILLIGKKRKGWTKKSRPVFMATYQWQVLLSYKIFFSFFSCFDSQLLLNYYYDFLLSLPLGFSSKNFPMNSFEHCIHYDYLCIFNVICKEFCVCAFYLAWIFFTTINQSFVPLPRG